MSENNSAATSGEWPELLTAYMRIQEHCRRDPENFKLIRVNVTLPDGASKEVEFIVPVDYYPGTSSIDVGFFGRAAAGAACMNEGRWDVFAHEVRTYVQVNRLDDDNEEPSKNSSKSVSAYVKPAKLLKRFESKASLKGGSYRMQLPRKLVRYLQLNHGMPISEEYKVTFTVYSNKTIKASVS
ncbi:MAG: hypothetical protein ABSA50_11900 [Candidatus Bathyarchaeia archaeon]|jgi:hypothetical protein